MKWRTERYVPDTYIRAPVGADYPEQITLVSINSPVAISMNYELASYKHPIIWCSSRTAEHFDCASFQLLTLRQDIVMLIEGSVTQDTRVMWLKLNVTGNGLRLGFSKHLFASGYLQWRHFIDTLHKNTFPFNFSAYSMSFIIYQTYHLPNCFIWLSHTALSIYCMPFDVYFLNIYF